MSEAAPTAAAPAADDSRQAFAALDAKAQKKLREQARATVLSEERERARKRREEREAKETKAPAAAEPAAPERTDADRARDLEVFLHLVWLLVGAACWPFGFRLTDLADTEASTDAPMWVPIARRYKTFDSIVTWVAAPVLLLRRVKSHLTRREPTPTPAPKEEVHAQKL